MEFFSINWATFILLLSCARLSQQIKTERHYFQNATDGEDFHENANIFGDLLSQFSCESGDVGNLSEADEDSLNPDCQQNPGVATERQDRSEQARDQKNVTDTKGHLTYLSTHGVLSMKEHEKYKLQRRTNGGSYVRVGERLAAPETWGSKFCSADSLTQIESPEMHHT